ncbi:MAG: hypothetical protein EOR73_32015 [Mesorhizobium sp.]|nr:MAG: hypothetical protein EOR73_32015 [Mesorhizobium sp.]
MFRGTFVTLALGAMLSTLQSTLSIAHAQPRSQYKAAMTKLFLDEYHAFAIFRVNPIYPGWVININNENPYLITCFPGQIDGNYRGTRDFSSGVQLSVDAGATVNGVLLSDKIAELEAGGDVAFEFETVVRVTPVSIDPAENGSAALFDWNRSEPRCKIIDGMRDGSVEGYFLVEQVVHGKVTYELAVNFAAGLSAQAKSDLLVKISRLFDINGTSIRVSGNRATFAVSKSPDNMTLAIVPNMLNHEEVTRIAYFMRGERGTDLEAAVQSALRERDVTMLDRLKIEIRNLLGGEIENRNRWAERMASGPKMVSRNDITDEQFDAISTYAAAMVIVGD